MAGSIQRAAPIRIVFLTREPIVHEVSGSTTYALGCIRLLQARGAEVTLVATTAYSRSPRLFFRVAVQPPPGLQIHFPGYLHVGRWYVLPFSLKGWARALTRFAVRYPWLRSLRALLQCCFGDALFPGAWNLTPPTSRESRVALRSIEAAGADTVMANYAFWGPLLTHPRMRERRTAILMHDLLSARVERLQAAGLPLDCPPITVAEERQWLAGAQTLLAAQASEADAIRPYVAARVLVTPIVLEPKRLSAENVIPGRCLFVGSNIVPNRTALAFLLESIWPHVRSQVPEATLAVAGAVAENLSGAAAAHAASLGVYLLGRVPALEAEYARAAVCVVPLLLGSGIKIKLLEALGFGKAIVSTGIGVQGLEAWASEAIEIADEAVFFAAAIVGLLRDNALRHRREAAALRLAEAHFGASRLLDREFREALL